MKMYYLFNKKSCYFIYLYLFIYLLLIYFLMFNIFWFNGNVFISSMFSISKLSNMLLLLTLWMNLLIYIMLDMSVKNQNIKNMINILFLILYFCFLSNNMLIFFFFFELSLIPTFFIIKLWGFYLERMLASYYLLLYTLFCSFPLLIMIFYLMNNFFTLDLLLFNMMFLKVNLFEFMFFILAFLVKLPMFLLHSWLPKAHVEAPVYGSMILAGILLKLGGYGLMMFLMFLNFNDNNVIFSISLLGCLLIGLLNLRMIDMKIVVAYSSIIHMGMMISSIFTYSQIGWVGSYMMMIAHGLISSGMFYMVNEFYNNTNSRLFNFNKGILVYAPSMHLMWFLLCSSNMAVPISLNLISEVFMLSSIVMYNMKIIFLLMFIIMLSSYYCLYLYIYISHGNTMINPNFKFNNNNVVVIMMHWIPMNLIFLKLDYFFL